MIRPGSFQNDVGLGEAGLSGESHSSSFQSGFFLSFPPFFSTQVLNPLPCPCCFLVDVAEVPKYVPFFARGSSPGLRPFKTGATPVNRHGNASLVMLMASELVDAVMSLLRGYFLPSELNVPAPLEIVSRAVIFATAVRFFFSSVRYGPRALLILFIAYALVYRAGRPLFTTRCRADDLKQLLP